MKREQVKTSFRPLAVELPFGYVSALFVFFVVKCLICRIYRCGNGLLRIVTGHVTGRHLKNPRIYRACNGVTGPGG